MSATDTTAHAASSAAAARPALGYLPSLDGLRGIAVAAVVAYHLDFGWAQGGYLGVSLFFTLSGYLISRLMMGEVERTGRVAVGAFWRRRIKRLAPASMVTLTSIVALEHLDPSIWSTTGFRSSMFGALFHVANWEALISGTGYFDLLGVASPVRHYWSLAIEEQFYLVFPLVVLVLIGSQRKRIDRLVPLAIVGIAISTVLTLLLSSNPERVYLGTDTRMAEILFGVLFGALHHRLGDRLGRRAASLALPALAIFILAVITLPASSPIISHGGLIVGGGIWAVLIVGVAHAGPTSRVGLAGTLAAEPLPYLGRISYALYLTHWPILQVLSQGRLGTGRLATVVIQVGVSVAVASAITFWIERPIRTWRPKITATVPLAWLTATTVVAGLILLPLPSSEASAEDLGAPLVTVPRGAPVQGAADVDFGDTVAEFGDSVGFTTFFVSDGWLQENVGVKVVGHAALGCGTMTDIDLQVAPGQPRLKPPPGCLDAAGMAELIAEDTPDVVLYMSLGIDLYDHEIDGEWTSLADPAFQQRYTEVLSAKLDALESGGATVLIGNVPPTQPIDANGVRVGTDFPERVRVLNDIIAREANERVGTVVLDYAGAVELAEQTVDLRPDGVHPNPELGSGWVDAYFGPIIIDAQSRALEEQATDDPAL
jgi:peptidoglycan/LPS O-acetylase OafA/YrhL